MQIQQAVHDQAGPSDQTEAAFAQQRTLVHTTTGLQLRVPHMKCQYRSKTENFSTQPLKQRN